MGVATTTTEETTSAIQERLVQLKVMLSRMATWQDNMLVDMKRMPVALAPTRCLRVGPNFSTNNNYAGVALPWRVNMLAAAPTPKEFLLGHPLQPSVAIKFSTPAPAVCSTECFHVNAEVQPSVFAQEATPNASSAMNMLDGVISVSTDKVHTSEVLTAVGGLSLFMEPCVDVVVHKPSAQLVLPLLAVFSPHVEHLLASRLSQHLEPRGSRYACWVLSCKPFAGNIMVYFMNLLLFKCWEHGKFRVLLVPLFVQSGTKTSMQRVQGCRVIVSQVLKRLEKCNGLCLLVRLGNKFQHGLVEELGSACAIITNGHEYISRIEGSSLCLQHLEYRNFPYLLHMCCPLLRKTSLGSRFRFARMSRCIKEGTYTHIHLPVVYGKKEVSGCYWFQRLRVVHDEVNVTVRTNLLLSTSAPVSLATDRCCTVQAFGFLQPYRLRDYKVTYSAAKQWDPGNKKALPWQDGCYVLTFEDLNTCQSSSSSYML